MLTISDKAAYAIRRITALREVPQSGGLRIAADGDPASLSITASTSPEHGDTVCDNGTGARLFVAEEVGELLQDRTLDAYTDGSGQVQFVLEPLGP